MRCRGTLADGSPCRAPESLVDGATGFCRSHGPGAIERLRAQGLRGAIATIRKRGGNGIRPDELPPLDGPEAAATWLEVVGRGVATGRLGHREAVAVTRAVSVWLAAHDAGAVAGEIAALRDALAEWKKSGDARTLLAVVEGGAPME